VRQGHDVTLFASGDSQTAATLVPICPRAQRLDGGRKDTLAEHILMVEHVFQRAREFDLIHFHIAQMHFPLARRLPTAHITTLHGRLDLPELVPLYREFSDLAMVSISDSQRAPLPDAGWIGTVYHGLPLDLLRFRRADDGYLAFLGRVSPEKRLDRAIAIAKASRRPLRIAAKVDPADRDYFERDILPLLEDPLITFIGEIGEAGKADFLGRAAALLFPIDWPEPFGLVQIEALACGTPVIAFRGGSVPEIVDHGVTGFVVDSIEEAVTAVGAIEEIDRRTCRQVFEQRFSVTRMAKDYVRIYKLAVANMATNLVA
jgi:glycosyltransferase involved in cell wall biosynthesis